jgi:hypothetical protein
MWLRVGVDWLWKVMSVIILPVAWWVFTSISDLSSATQTLHHEIKTLNDNRVTRDEFAGLLRAIDACAKAENVPRRSDLDKLNERILYVERQQRER